MAATCTKLQIKMIRGLAAKVFPHEENYRDWLCYNFFRDDVSPKRTSTKQLTKGEAHAAIKLLKQSLPNTSHVSSNDAARDGRKPAPRYLGCGLNGGLTQTQANTIALLESKLGWDDNAKRLEGFIARQIGKTKKVEWLRNREASKVITGLKRLLEGNNESGRNQA